CGAGGALHRAAFADDLLVHAVMDAAGVVQRLVRSHVRVVVVAGLHAVLHHGEVVGQQFPAGDLVVVLDAAPQVGGNPLVGELLEHRVGLDHVDLGDVPGRLVEIGRIVAVGRGP